MSETENPKDTRQRIIEAASELAAQVGYARATTKAIAEAAGVNEVTLFRHFGTKQDLFAAAIDQYGGPAMAPALEAQLTGDYRQDLVTVGNIFLAILLERREMLQLLLCESAHIPNIRTVLARNPREFREMLARYFQSHIEQGTVKEQHPEAMAQAFLGMFFAYAISLGILEEAIKPPLPNSELVAQFVDIFVAGTLDDTTQR